MQFYILINIPDLLLHLNMNHIISLKLAPRSEIAGSNSISNLYKNHSLESRPVRFLESCKLVDYISNNGNIKI